MRRVFLIAARDFKATVMTGAFFFAVVGMPLLMAGVGLGALLLIGAHEDPALTGTVAVVARPDALRALATELDPATLRAHREEVMERSRAVGGELLVQATHMLPEASGAALRLQVEPATALDEALVARVRTGELLAAAALPEAAISGHERLHLVVRADLDGDSITRLENSLGDAAVRLRAERRGLEPTLTRALLRRPNAETRRVLEDGQLVGASSGLRLIRKSVVPAVFMLLLWAGAFAAGQQLLFSTIEEKSNKLMEVLLSAISPVQLMAGKILGQGLVGLLIVSVYSSMGVAALIGLARHDLVSGGQLALLGAYFLMAYFMIAPIMAAIGSAVSTVHEANSLLMPVMVLLMVPLGLWFPISQEPNGWLAIAFSFTPPVMPFVMALRLAAEGGVPAYQVALSLAWGATVVGLLVWGAARVFRVGLLMEGKPPSVLELLRWARVG